MSEETTKAAGEAALSSVPDVPEGGIGTFIDYRRTVLRLTADLKRLKGFALELGLVESAELIAEVLERIERDRFSVAVVGEFKRGKSTFINALLGVSVLPTDVLPTTATLNRVTYGLQPRTELIFRDGRKEEVPFDRLAEYVTKLTDESAQVASTIAEAVVHYPSPYCQNNVEVYDTPGLNDDEAMTAVTLSLLPRIDVAIMVILAQSPFSETEREFLESRLLGADLGRVVFVVNGIDNFNRPEDADRVVASVERTIKERIIERARRQYGDESPEYEAYVRKIGRPRVFGLSAYQAVQAKQAGPAQLLEASRFPAFETELQRLLTEGRGAVTLQVPVNRVITASRELLDAIATRTSALSLQRDEFESAYRRSSEEIDALRRQTSEELLRVREAGERTMDELRPLIAGLPSALREACGRAIDAAAIEPSDLDEDENLQERLGKHVDAALRLESERHAGLIQERIQDALLAEIDRLAEFEEAIGGLMGSIRVNFGGVQAEQHYGGRGEAAAAAIAVFTGMGGVWSGYRQAGAKGAAVGALASAGTVLGAAMVLGMLAIPVTWPVAIAVLLGATMPGAWVARWAFPGERVDRFRESYKEAVLKELDRSLVEANLRQLVHEQVQVAFDGLRERVRREADATLADAEATLTGLRARYERQSALGEAEREDLEAMEKAALEIAGNAAGVSRQLVAIQQAMQGGEP